MKKSYFNKEVKITNKYFKKKTKRERERKREGNKQTPVIKVALLRQSL